MSIEILYILHLVLETLSPTCSR